MPRYLVLILVLFALACKNKTTTLSANQPVNASDFFAAFHKLNLPYNVADTNMKKAGDTTLVSYDVLKQFIPDTALQTLASKRPEGLKIHPVGKIENEDGTYLLAMVTDGKKTTLVTYLFDKSKHYLGHLSLLNNTTDDAYIHSVNINTEPTFLLSRDKTDNNVYKYTRNGYAYSKENKSFVEVINDSNEDEKKNNEIINPIDTLAKKNKLSGDYTKDKKNFISIRDGNSASNYNFFVHFEKDKDNGGCTGELKGAMTILDESKAVFQQKGDPCVIDFTFKGNTVQVKERGSCGNHRGMTCLFDDNYKRKKEPVPPAKKGKRK